MAVLRDVDMQRRLQLTKWCSNRLHHLRPAYCYIQLDGSHIPAEHCRCHVSGEVCPVDWHTAADIEQRLGDPETWE